MQNRRPARAPSVPSTRPAEPPHDPDAAVAAIEAHSLGDTCPECPLD